MHNASFSININALPAVLGADNTHADFHAAVLLRFMLFYVSDDFKTTIFFIEKKCLKFFY